MGILSPAQHFPNPQSRGWLLEWDLGEPLREPGDFSVCRTIHDGKWVREGKQSWKISSFIFSRWKSPALLKSTLYLFTGAGLSQLLTADPGGSLRHIPALVLCAEHGVCPPKHLGTSGQPHPCPAVTASQRQGSARTWDVPAHTLCPAALPARGQRAESCRNSLGQGSGGDREIHVLNMTQLQQGSLALPSPACPWGCVSRFGVTAVVPSLHTATQESQRGSGGLQSRGDLGDCNPK